MPYHEVKTWKIYIYMTVETSFNPTETFNLLVIMSKRKFGLAKSMNYSSNLGNIFFSN